MSVPDTAPSMPSEETIEKIVRGFYAKARTDDEIGPIFARAIGDWEPHLSKMCDFWSSVMRTSGRYHGNPMLAHLRLKSVQPRHFERWLELFRSTARDVASKDEAEHFIDRAETIAKSLQLGMFYRPVRSASAKPDLIKQGEN